MIFIKKNFFSFRDVLSAGKERFFSLPAYAVCGLLLFPFFLFLFQFKNISWPKGSEPFFVFLMTLLQAALSASVGLAAGLLGSRGLLPFYRKKYYFLIEGLAALPCFTPPLLVVLSLVHLVEAAGPFPFGFAALIFVQSLSWAGLCSVVFARLFIKQAPLLSEWAALEGASSWLFFKASVKSFLFKDVKTLWVLIFISCFTGLSFPLLAGGSSFFSFEFFIYEKLKDPRLWPEAVGLILFQSGFVFILCLKAFAGVSSSDFQTNFKKIYLLPKMSFSIIPFLALFFSLGGLFFISDAAAFSKLLPLSDLILSAGLNSLLIGLGAGALTLLFLALMALSFQNIKARKFISAFSPPGAAFMGFAFLLWPFYSEAFVLIKWTAGLSLLIFPWIYRFRGERALEESSKYIEAARLLGAGWTMIFSQIIWPRSRSMFFFCAGAAGFWACGDFSYSLIVAGGHWSLSLAVYDLFSSYRLDLAILLSWLLLFLCFFVFIFWQGVKIVFSKKSIL